MDNNEAKLHEKVFYSVFSYEYHNDTMTHNTWYTLDKDIWWNMNIGKKWPLSIEHRTFKC